MAGAGKTSRPRALGLGRDQGGTCWVFSPLFREHLSSTRGFDVWFITPSAALKTVPGQEQTPNKELLNPWLLPSPHQRSTQAVVRMNKWRKE